MQTSFMIADHPFQEREQGAPAAPFPQFQDRVRDDRDASRGRLSFFERTDEKEATPSNKIDESISFMTHHLNQPLQVATLAALVNISPSHYFALFKRRTGRAPMDYFTRLRMEEARRLLDTTTSSVKEVAGALGYDDPFYFSRVFKSVHQVAPSNYRMQQRVRAESRENSPCET